MSFQSLKIPELKAKCKELGIQGFSKLTKPQLIQRLLEVAASHSAAVAVSLPPAVQDSDPTQVGSNEPYPELMSDQTILPLPNKLNSGEVDWQLCPKVRKRATERKDTLLSEPKTKRHASKTAGKIFQSNAVTNNEARIVSQQTPIPAAPFPTVHYTHPLLITNSLTNNVQVGASSVPDPLPTSALADASNKSKTPRTMPQLPLLASVPRPRPTSTPKPKKRLPTHVHHKFIPLKRVSPCVIRPSSLLPVSLLYPLFPLTSDEPDRDKRIDNRVAHVKSHFLNRLFLHLHAARIHPLTTPPYPTPIPYPPGPTSDLAFQGIHPKLFLEPGEALLVALRWWLVRAHTMFQLGSGQEWSTYAGGTGMLGPDMALWPPVVECQRVVDGIYLVVTESREQMEVGDKRKRKTTKVAGEVKPTRSKYLVLSQTGEVIGRSIVTREPIPVDKQISTLQLFDCKVRPDWHHYITSRQEGGKKVSDESDILCESTTPAGRTIGIEYPPLMNYVKTKDGHSFPFGTSKQWATKMEQGKDGWEGEALRVAERVVLASCVLNSFSGEKLSSLQMDTEWLGNAIESRRGTQGKVELYLPESHQVLSIHFPPPPFHPALAIAHRSSGTSEIVLRETGQAVGGEDGVVELWQGILGCDSRGNEVADVNEFWAEWELRARGIENE